MFQTYLLNEKSITFIKLFIANKLNSLKYFVQ